MDTFNFVLLRSQRDEILKATDKCMLVDFPIADSDLTLMKTYMQQLRDYMDLPDAINYNSSNNIPLPPFPQPPF